MPCKTLATKLIIDLGGCCLGGGICGPGVCSLYSSFTATVTSASSGEQTGLVLSTITSTSVSSQIDPTLTSVFSVVVPGTETASRVTTTVFATGGATGGLTAGQIGGISAGAVVGFLLLVALGWLIVRHLIRISRFMDNFNKNRELPEKPIIKEDSHGRAVELTEIDSSNGGNGEMVTELSPQERPQLLEEWGRHGSRGNELTGSYEAHGLSELDSASVVRT